MSLFHSLSFFRTVASLDDFPSSIAEVAFVGRSNAGKSSAINTLANHTRLAFVSKTPGRTQHINFFSLGEDRFLVDLPGYGYARAPQTVRKNWEGLLDDYLQTRQALQGLILIMDIRHPLKPKDVQMIDWFKVTGKPIHILLTKADKLSRQQANATLKMVKEKVAYYSLCSVQTFSSLNREGQEELEGRMRSLLLIN